MRLTKSSDNSIAATAPGRDQGLEVGVRLVPARLAEDQHPHVAGALCGPGRICPPTARCLVPRLPWHTLVDGAARATRLALRYLLSAGDAPHAEAIRQEGVEHPMRAKPEP